VAHPDITKSREKNKTPTITDLKFFISVYPLNLLAKKPMQAGNIPNNKLIINMFL
jgi:hypothetical protein